MASDDSNERSMEADNELESDNAPGPPKLKNYRIRIPLVQARLFDQRGRARRLLDFLKARPSIDWFKKLRVSSPLAIFRRTVEEREEFSLSVPSPVGIRRRFPIHFIRKINWASLFCMCKEWLMNPKNIALLIWLICVAVSASMLGLLMVGVLNKAFPTRSLRNHWIEINNQVLNALFTLMSIYQHPILFHHLFLLCRWRSEDIIELRKIYCKNGAYRPHEWAHIMVVVVFLHLTCFSQYALCGLYWGYTSHQRPEFLDDLFLALGIAAPVFAGLYTVYSPLGREFDIDPDEESQTEASTRSNKLRLKLYDRRVIASRPEWIGGLFDCWDDMTVYYLSCFCTFCVFGWNMERLGFGNMYVHLFTFLLLCVAPLWILGISALNINNDVIADVVGITGLVLCVFGLLYGGFWRIQMRKRFKLPENKLCCGSASMTDYIRWMFCWSCSLAQEVRTGNFYDVEDDSLYMKLIIGDQESQAPSHPPESGTSPNIRSTCSSPLLASVMADSPGSDATKEECSSSACLVLVTEEEPSELTLDNVMIAPVPPLIQLEDRVSGGDVVAPSLTSPRNPKQDGSPPWKN